MLAFSRFSSAARLLLAAVVVSVFPVAAVAQPTPIDIDQTAAAVVRTQRAETTVVYPYGLAGTPLTGAGLVASQENKRVFVRLGRPIGRIGEFGLSASAPLDENADRSSILQLDGLANKSKVGGEVRFGWHRLPNSDDVGHILTELKLDTCREQARRDAEKARLEAERARAAGEKPPDIAVTSCADLGTLMTTSVMDDYRNTAYFLTLKGDIGPAKFTFTELPSTETTERKWSRSGSVVGGALLPNNVYVSGGLRFEHGFEEPDQQAVCTAAPPAACPLKVVGGPSDDIRRVVEAEVRQYIAENAGLSFMVRHDWKREETSIEIPIYFVRNKDGGLTGGVSIGHLWSADEKQQGARFSVFVGQLFGLSQ